MNKQTEHLNTILYFCFIALFHASMQSQMFYKIDVLENCANLTGKRLYQAVLTPKQIFF